MNKKTTSLALSAALALGSSGFACSNGQADFQASDLKSGYQNGQKLADGSCGSKDGEHKCGEQKCGEGSCGSKDDSSDQS